MFGLETMQGTQVKHFSDMYDVFRQGMAVNQNTIKEFNDGFSFHWLQDAIHHM